MCMWFILRAKKLIFFFLHNQTSGPRVKCLQCHEEVPMHELRHHTEEVHGKTQKVGLSSLFTIQPVLFCSGPVPRHSGSFSLAIYLCVVTSSRSTSWRVLLDDIKLHIDESSVSFFAQLIKQERTPRYKSDFEPVFILYNSHCCWW